MQTWCKHIRNVWISIAFLTVAYNIESPAQTSAAWHEMAITAPEFDTTRLHAYQLNPEFRYMQRAPETSWLGALWQEIKDAFRSLFSEGKGFTSRVILILLLLAATVAFALFLLRVRFRGFLARTDQRRNDGIPILQQEIPEVPLHELAASASARGDYRTAFRWIYLDMLRNLAGQGRITLHKEKTNRDYKREMHAADTHHYFVTLADAFDFIWYGEYPISRNDYERFVALSATVLQETPTR